MSKLTLDEAIKHCLEVAGEQQERADSAELIDILDGLDVEDCKKCAADHRQLAEWLTELKDSRAVQNEQEIFIHELMGELEEAKRLLKAAVEDLSCGGENNKCTKSCKTCTYNPTKGYGCRYFGEYHWRYTDEALALIGEEGEQNG